MSEVPGAVKDASIEFLTSGKKEPGFVCISPDVEVFKRVSGDSMNQFVVVFNPLLPFGHRGFV